MPWFQIVPRLGLDPVALARLVLRVSRFVFEVHRRGSVLELYLWVELGEASLEKIVGAKRVTPPAIPEHYFFAELRFSEDNIMMSMEPLGWDDAYELLPDGTVLQIMAWRDPKANRVLARKARALMRGPGQGAGRILDEFLDGILGSPGPQGSYMDPAWLRERQLRARRLLERASKPLYVVRARLYGPDRRALREVAGMLASRFTVPLRVHMPLLGGRVGRRDTRRIPGPSGILSRPPMHLPWMIPEELRGLLVLPDPSTLPVAFARGAGLPRLAPERSGPNAVRIGVLEDGREFRVSTGDLERHTYVVGMTGSGKSTLLWNLALRLRRAGRTCVVVIDPHGDLAMDILSSLEDLGRVYLLDPLRKPFGLNPLDLPRLPDRDHAISLAVDQLIAIFEKVLRLPETAVNVRYLLQVLLRLMYSRTDSPTLGDIYNAIVGLRLGTLDLPVDDPEWRVQVELLRRVQDQTFLSALSRLEPFAHNKLLSRMTSRTTVDLGELLRPGSLVLFRISKAELGEGLLQLLAPSIVLRLWFYVLERAMLNRPRTPIVVVVDEFQNMAGLPVVETILSEARKYGLHLVMAHQHTRQIPDDLLQSVFSNTGVKVVFRVGGHDVDRLARLDRDFADRVAKTLTSLTIGRALVQLTARPGEQQPLPVVVITDPPPPRRRDPWKALDLLPDFAPPPDVGGRDPAELLNPVLGFLPEDRPGPVELLVLYGVYRLGGRGGAVPWARVVAGLGARRPQLDEARDSLAARGYVEAWKEGNRWVVRYVKGLFRGLKRVAPSREGRRVARRAVLYYLSRGFYVVPARQDPGPGARPDLVAIPLDRASWSPRYGEAVAVEVESCNEVETHPDQVSRNLAKNHELVRQGSSGGPSSGPPRDAPKSYAESSRKPPGTTTYPEKPTRYTRSGRRNPNPRRNPPGNPKHAAENPRRLQCPNNQQSNTQNPTPGNPRPPYRSKYRAPR